MSDEEFVVEDYKGSNQKAQNPLDGSSNMKKNYNDLKKPAGNKVLDGFDDSYQEKDSRKQFPTKESDSNRLKFDSLEVDRNKRISNQPIKQIEKDPYDSHDFDADDNQSHVKLQEHKTPDKQQQEESRKDLSQKQESPFEKDKSSQNKEIFDLKPSNRRHSNLASENKTTDPEDLQSEVQFLSFPDDKTKDQNQKLKQELLMIAKAYDLACQKEMERRRHRSKEETENSELLQKQSEIKGNYAKIDTLKTQIMTMRRQLENTYSSDKVTQKENELKAGQRELEGVLKEREGLIKIKAEQGKALQNLKNENLFDAKLNQVTEDLRRAKELNKLLNEQVNQNEKVLKKNHEKIVDLEERCREIQAKIHQKKTFDAQKKHEKLAELKNEKGGKHKGKTTKLDPKKKEVPSFVNIDVTETMIKQLEARLSELKEKKGMLEKKFDENYRKAGHDRKEMELESAKLQAIIREKEKEVRLNNLRLKEIKKLSFFNAGKRDDEQSGSFEVPDEELLSGGEEGTGSMDLDQKGKSSKKTQKPGPQSKKGSASKELKGKTSDRVDRQDSVNLKLEPLRDLQEINNTEDSLNENFDYDSKGDEELSDKYQKDNENP